MDPRISAAIAALVLLIVGLAAPGANAANHALLIGIGQYQTRVLEGPPYDVAALKTVLATRYDFNTANIRTLVDQEANKNRILAELDQLIHRSRSGDRIFIYFSGHGTSRRDDFMALPLPHASGALVPADFSADPSQSLEDMMSQLIVGRRDLRPVLEELDRDRQVLLVFDTCFAGNTVRAGSGHKVPESARYIQLASKSVFDEERSMGSFEDNLAPIQPYPYRNIFYIAASSENEIAKDIQEDLLYLYPTIDGKPHGAFTDALLRVLSGQVPVDADNNGQWSQMELFTAVRSLVQERFRQTPQALPERGENAENLHARSFFVHAGGRLAGDAVTPAAGRARLRVRIADELSLLKRHLTQVEGVEIVRTAPDLTITPDGDTLVLARPDKHPLCRFTAFDVQAVLDRIRRHLRIQPLINLDYPQQPFHIELALKGGLPHTILHEGEPFGFEIRTAKPAYLLLIDIDPAGAVHVLYPSDRSELIPVAPGERRSLAEGFRTHWPFGTETVKLFAFTHRPEMLARLIGKEDIHPSSALFHDLERLVGVRGAKAARAHLGQEAAQASIELTSYPRAPGKR